MNNKQAGFTLIEALLVFCIFVTISLITAFTLKPQYFQMNDQVFLSQLKADLLYGQQYAISHQSEVTVIFAETEPKYSLNLRYNMPSLVERDYPQNIKVYGGSLPLTFKFLPDGNISKFGSFYISSGTKLYRFTVLIGKGRFYVTQEK